jgi:hypothetical protein
MGAKNGLTLRQEQRLMTLENKVLVKISEPKKKEVTEKWSR